MTRFSEQLRLLKEELDKITPSLPDNPKALFRKVSIAFPELKTSIGMNSVKVIHGNIIFIKCKTFNVYFMRSKREYSKLDIAVKKDGNHVDKKEGVFFEEFERVLTSMLKPILNEYEVGDLDKYKPSTSSSSQNKKKIGTNRSTVNGVAGSLATAMNAVKGRPDVEKEVLRGISNEFEDFDDVVDDGSFKTAVGDNKTYSRIKKAHEDNKK